MIASRSTFCPSVERVAGASRFATAVELARVFRPNARHFIVVGGGGATVDAIAAGPLGARMNAPILLSDADALPPELMELVGPGDEVIVLGGTAALSAHALAELLDLGARVERISGDDRFQTAAEVALRFGRTDTAIVVSGDQAALADALVASAAGAHMGVPVLLSARDHVPQATADVIDALGVSRTIVIGGATAISDEVLDALPGAERIGGKDRFETADAVTRALHMDMSTALLVEATPSADAVAATALGLPLVYTTTDGVPEVSSAMLTRADRLVMIGGTAVVSKRVEAEVCAILDSDEVPEPELLISCPSERSLVDRPDDSNEDQVRVLYVLPADAPDEELDIDDTICTSVLAWNRWFELQSGGSTMRLDRHQDTIDIGFVRLPQTDAAMRGSTNEASIDHGIAFVRDRIERELRAAGLLAPNKLYAVYYGGTSDFSCGGAAFPPELVGQVAAMYLGGQPPGFDRCDTRPWGIDIDMPQYFDYAMVHEIVHTLGFVADGTPNQHVRSHVFDIGVDTPQRDLMYAPRDASDPGWDVDAELILDIGRDDYWGHGISGIPDLARSSFLHPLPAAPERPPGW